MTYGEKVKAARKTLGFTLKEVAEATGTTECFISLIERGKRTPSVAIYVLIAVALHMDVSITDYITNVKRKGKGGKNGSNDWRKKRS